MDGMDGWDGRRLSRSLRLLRAPNGANKQSIHNVSSQFDESDTGLTPLMHAASKAADETVAFLLSKGASPDIIDNTDGSALVMAIHSECSSTIALCGS